MVKVHNSLEFQTGAKISGLPTSTTAGEPVVHEQLAGLTGGVTDSSLAGDVYTSADVASAATCDIGAAATCRVNITGTTTITSFGTSADRLRILSFAGALTLTHNATSLILPGGANITTAAGDTAIFTSSETGNWRCIAYVKANGKALVAPATSDITGLDASLSAKALADASNISDRLGIVGKDITSTDLNSSISSGWYMGQTVTNAPDTGWWLYQVLLHNASWAVQIAYPFTDKSKGIRIRWLENAVWSAWSLLVTGGANVQEFSASGTWTKPSSGTYAIIELWGGGGSGARGAYGGGGGGGGAYSRSFKLLSELSATESVTIGTGGAAKTTNGNGNAGGATSFGSHLTAYGGAGGDAANGYGGGGGGSLGAGDTAAGNGGDGHVTSFDKGGLGGATAADARSYYGGGGGGQGIGGGATSAGGRSHMGGGGGGGKVNGSSTVYAGGVSAGGGSGGAGGGAGAGVNGAIRGGGGGASPTTSGAGGGGYCIVTVI